MDHADAVTFADAAQWEAWLADHHDRERDVWLRIAKRGSTTSTVTIGEALDVALCWGWIDSQRKAGDEDHYLQRYSPRRQASPWSQINAARAQALDAAGRMRAPGRAAMRAAQADGRWPAADP